jgi:cytochrome b
MFNIEQYLDTQIPLAVRSMVCERLFWGIAGSNPATYVDVPVCCFEVRHTRCVDQITVMADV